MNPRLAESESHITGLVSLLASRVSTLSYTRPKRVDMGEVRRRKEHTDTESKGIHTDMWIYSYTNKTDMARSVAEYEERTYTRTGGRNGPEEEGKGKGKGGTWFLSKRGGGDGDDIDKRREGGREGGRREVVGQRNGGC